MHPLLPDLSKMPLEELQQKYATLNNRFVYASRSARTEQVYQLQLLIQSYAMEMQRRDQQQLAELEKNSKTFKSIIDIK